MKILCSIVTRLYIVAMLIVVFIVFAIPKCKAQPNFFTADDFRGSKMRGLNFSIVPDFASLKAKDLPGARATGANHGRYWLQINHDANNNYFYCDRFGKPLSISPLPTLDSAVRMAQKINLPLILTVEILPRQDKADYWGEPTRQANIIKKWVELATRYKDKTIIAAYDLMNEPRYNSTTARGTTKQCVEFQADIITAIRKVDPNHVIVVEVLKNQMLGDLSIRKDSVVFKQRLMNIKNLVYSPHGYSYTNVTHQGSSGTIRYPYRDTTNYDYSKTFLSNSYWQEPLKFQKKYNAVIWVGEFSCINWARQNKAGTWTSTQWIADAILFMEANGWSWAHHAWREYQGWDPEFPSSWYQANATFTNAKPSSLPPSSARDSNSPTMLVLKKAFLKNKPL